jgi:PleD family two-component response regulator
VVIDDGESIDVSISIGGAWMSGDTEMSVDEIIAAADRSLYAAKTAGRDRTGLVLTVPGVPLA